MRKSQIIQSWGDRAAPTWDCSRRKESNWYRTERLIVPFKRIWTEPLQKAKKSGKKKA